MTPDSFGEPNADMYALYAMEKVASSGRSLRFPLRRSAGAKYLSGVEVCACVCACVRVGRWGGRARGHVTGHTRTSLRFRAVHRQSIRFKT